MKTRPLVVVAAYVAACLLACNRTPPENQQKAAAPAAPAPAPASAHASASASAPAGQSPVAGIGQAVTGGATAAPPASPPDAAAPSTLPGSAAGAGAVSAPPPSSPATPPTPPGPSSPLALLSPAGKPHTDNLVALEMGGRVEYLSSREMAEYGRIKLLDGNPNTIFALSGSGYPVEVVVSFLNHDVALVSGVTLTLPPRGPIPIYDKPNDAAWAKDVEIWTSMDGNKTGFHKVAAATLPQESGDHEVTLAAPVEARYVKVAIVSNYGSPITPMLADLAVREGRAVGYVPFLQRHADLASLLSTGTLPVARTAAAAADTTAAADLCVKPERPDVHPTIPESRRVLVVARGAEVDYTPFNYRINVPKEPDTRYFTSAPGDGRIDSSIFQRADFWPVSPEAAAPAALVPSGGVDTVVLAQLCDIKTKMGDGFKRALVSWVAAGHKLIIQDSDSCGQFREPDYSFLPYPFATSNPGAQGAASVLRLIENSFLASTDPADPAFLDLDSWAKKTNGNPQNDFGDSNTVIKYDQNWCGAIVGTNVKGASGFVLVYAHYGDGVIIYDGVDRDQGANVAYRQYLARQLLLPFAPDALPCSTRLSPFVVATDAPLVTRTVLPGQTYTYPISIVPVTPTPVLV